MLFTWNMILLFAGMVAAEPGSSFQTCSDPDESGTMLQSMGPFVPIFLMLSAEVTAPLPGPLGLSTNDNVNGGGFRASSLVLVTVTPGPY